MELIKRPNDVINYKKIVKDKISWQGNNVSKLMIDNISYNLQYLDMLYQLVFNHLNSTQELHVVHFTQTIKTFIITIASIIECVLFNEVKRIKKNVGDLHLIYEFSSNKGDCVLKSQLFKKGDIFEKTITFDSMIKIVEKQELLGGDHDIYKYLKGLRKLRNKIHLHIGANGGDSDRFSFNLREFHFAQECCKVVLFTYFGIPENKLHDLFVFLDKSALPSQPTPLSGFY